MADKTNRLHSNAPGRYYVDDTCIDCDMCREQAPLIFVRDDEVGMSYVLRQPETDAETAQAEEAMLSCPTQTIGNDG